MSEHPSSEHPSASQRSDQTPDQPPLTHTWAQGTAAQGVVALRLSWLLLGTGLVVLLLLLLLGMQMHQLQQLRSIEQQVERDRVHGLGLQRSIDSSARQLQNAEDRLTSIEQRLDSLVAFDGLTLPVAEALNEVNQALQFLGQVQWRTLQPQGLGASATDQSGKKTKPRSKPALAATAAQGKEADSRAERENPLQGVWIVLKDWLIYQLGDWIRLRPIASVDMAQMDSAQIQSARAQLTIQLLSARLALLSNQIPLARSHLAEAKKLGLRILHPRSHDQQKVLQAIVRGAEKLGL